MRLATTWCVRQDCARVQARDVAVAPQHVLLLCPVHADDRVGPARALACACARPHARSALHVCPCACAPLGPQVQYVLELGQVEASQAIIAALAGRFAELSLQKFSSNVVEKCLKLGGVDAEREGIIREIITSPLLPRLLQVRLRA